MKKVNKTKFGKAMGNFGHGLGRMADGLVGVMNDVGDTLKDTFKK